MIKERIFKVASPRYCSLEATILCDLGTFK